VVVVLRGDESRNQPTLTVDAVDVDFELRFDSQRLRLILVNLYTIRNIKS
jgi:hypothetical protein